MSQNVMITGAGKAEILRELFEKKRNDFEGHRFTTNLDEDYPF